MKALKEKRLSLRSFLRRGLVILSLFALVFASCGDSGGDGGDPTDPGITPPPAAPYVESITLLVAAPTNPSFQGMPPDLTGMALEVKWSNEASPKRVDGDLRSQGFYTVPNYCDEPGTGASVVGSFSVVHRSSTASSGLFTPPAVIWLDSLYLTSNGPVNWYSDQRPVFPNLVLTGKYQWNSKAPETDNTGLSNYANCDKFAELTIPLSVGYPDLDSNKVVKSKIIEVTVGGIASSPQNEVKAQIPITNYYQVLGVKYANVSGDFFAFDDDTNISGLANKATLRKKVADAKATFDITYEDGTTRNITWIEFLDNVTYAYAQQSINLDPDKIFYADDSTRTEGSGATILKYNDDDYTWTFMMEYVPKEYLDSAHAYTARFPVALPVYEFRNEIAVARVAGATNDVEVGYASTNAAMDVDLFKAISDRWTLTGQYARGNDVKTKKIGWNSQFFHDGFGVGSNVINLNAGTISTDIPTAVASSILVERNWPLPLLYRAEPLTDEDTVTVTVTYPVP
jgi:hypothetical protein